MATNNIPTVKVSLNQIARRDLEAQEKKAQEAHAQAVARDSVELGEGGTGMASTAEASPPPHHEGSHHDRIKKSHDHLKSALEDSGEKVKVGEEIEEKALHKLDTLDQQLETLKTSGGRPEEIARLQKVRDQLNMALGVHLTHLTGDTSQLGSATPVAATMNAEEQALWSHLEQSLKGAGPDVQKALDARDLDALQSALSEQFGSESQKLLQEEKDLKAQAKELQAKLQKATPGEKEGLEKQFLMMKSQATALTQKQKNLLQTSTQFNNIAGQIAQHTVAHDLGLNFTGVGEHIKDIIQNQLPNHQYAPGTNGSGYSTGQGGTSGTSNNGQSPSGPSGTSGSSGTFTPPPTVGSSSGQSGQTGQAGLNTTPGGSAGAIVTGSGLDLSNNSYMISSTGSNVRSEAKKLDKLIKKLLQAALAGNWEAVKAALIFLDKRASTATINMGAQTIKAMQSYEKQMSILSDSLGKLKASNPDYNSKLAKINSDMNLYSMNRQAISNFLRDTMTMREEVANMTHSVLQADQRISSSISRG